MAHMAKKIRGRPSQEVLDKLSEDGVSPVEVMVLSMRRLYKEYDECLEQSEFSRSDATRESIMRYGKDCLREACEIAKNVAPYFHPRLQSVTVSGDDENPLAVELTNANDLRKFLRGGTTAIPPKSEDK
jgi:hypothetical protein